MNIVKLQNDLKDLSDQQLLSSMQMGSAPQYLVLAEMQRRKKMRDEASTQAPQNEGTVADEIMGGITQLPMQAPQMASGGLVSFATGGYAKGEAEACWTNPETGEKMCPPGKPDIRYPSSKKRSAEDVKMQQGGIVALQAGGSLQDAIDRLTSLGVSTEGKSEEEIMALAGEVPVPRVDVDQPVPSPAADTGIAALAQNADYDEEGMDASYLAKPLDPAEVLAREPKNAAEYLESLAVTEGLGADVADIAKEMGDPEIAPSTLYRQGPMAGETTLDQELVRRSGIRALQPETVSDYNDLVGMARRLQEESLTAEPPRDEELRQEAASLLQTAFSLPEGINQQVETIYDYAEEGTPSLWDSLRETYQPESAQSREAALEKAQQMYADLQGMPPSPERDAALERITPYMERYAGKNLLDRVGTALKSTFNDPVREARIGAEKQAEAKKEADKKAAAAKAEADKKAATAAADTRQGDMEQELLDKVKSAGSTPAEDQYLAYLRKRYEGDGKGDNKLNEALMRMGLSMMASKNPDFMGALGEGGIEGLKAFQASRKAEEEARQKLMEEEGAYRRAQVAAEAMSPYRAASAAVDRAKEIKESIDSLRDPLGRIRRKAELKTFYPEANEDALNAMIDREISVMEQQRQGLLGIMGMQQGAGLNMQMNPNLLSGLGGSSIVKSGQM